MSHQDKPWQDHFGFVRRSRSGGRQEDDQEDSRTGRQTEGRKVEKERIRDGDVPSRRRRVDIVGELLEAESARNERD